MVFSSIIFIVYFLPVFLLTYYFTPIKYKNVCLLVFSILFYSWGAPRFIFVILGTTFLDFYLVRWMYDADTKFKKNVLVTLSVLMNIGLLCWFKYANFFIENVNEVLAQLDIHQVAWVNILLPIGISFYTFETITYVVDTYRGEHKPLANVWDYQLYIMFFPKLIAGPIVRFRDLADQISAPLRDSLDTSNYRLMGFYRFAIGLAKKVVIANQVGVQADLILNQADFNLLSSPIAWIGILAYSLQIYFDFSGYSDMAIGIARMVGFRIPENFNNPYVASSITDFWRRWHISLGNWMREYLYIPLGGNRVSSKWRHALNLWIVFLVSGLWHGAAWTFVFWGAYHGAFLVLERLFLGKFYAIIGRIASTLISFVLIMIGWVFFRLESIPQSFQYISRMFQFAGSHSDYTLLDERSMFFVVIGVFFAFITMNKYGLKWHNWFYTTEYSISKHVLVGVMALVLLTVSLSFLAANNFNPFIYFRF